MSRILKLVVSFSLLALLTAAVHSQSVDEAARANKETQKPHASKTYTNEDIPSADEPAASEKKDSDGKTGEAKQESKAEGEQSAENKGDDKADPKSLEKEWTGKVNAQKEKIASLEKEQQLTTREYKLRAAVFYADAGNRLRDQKRWDDTEQKYKADMAKLDQDLKAAKEELEVLREKARKAGVKVD